jgi:methionine-rich copper-binding protein CopC
MAKSRTILLALAFIVWSAAADAHAMLDHASPAVGSTVASSPGAVTLYFTEALEPKFSAAEVHSAGGERVDHGGSVSGSTMRRPCRLCYLTRASARCFSRKHLCFLGSAQQQ